MAKKKRSSGPKMDQKWLKALGAHIEQVIHAKGFNSPYDFWINKAGDRFSRSALNYIIQGKRDPRASTLKVLADLLGVEARTLLDFKG